MGKFTISKIISLLIFMITFIVFLVWMISYSTDLAIIFGLRASNVVANDVAGRISSLASVNGGASVEYKISGDKLSSQTAAYDIRMRDYIVCVKSLAASTITSDCASYPFVLEEKNGYDYKGLTSTKLLIEKFYDSAEKKYKVRVRTEAV